MVGVSVLQCVDSVVLGDRSGVRHVKELATHPQGFYYRTRMWANAQPDGRPAEHRWRPLFNAAKFGRRPLLDAVQ